MKSRLIAPDLIKGIAIILMVYGHITYIGDSSAFQGRLVRIIYTFHIPLFLIISGFFFKVSKPFNEQFENVIRKIGIPYIIFISLYLVGLLLISKTGIPISNKPPTSFLLFFKSVFLKPIGAYWFLHSLVIINLVLISIQYLVKKESVFILYVFSFISFILLDILGYVKIRTSTYFMLGFILRHLTSTKIKVPIYTVFIFMPICFFLFSQKSAFIFSPIEIINCFLIFSCLWALSDYFDKSRFVKIISWIGQNTLIILLLHALFIVAFKPFKSLFLHLDSSGIFYSIVVTIVTVALCILTSRVFDKLKISKYIFNTNEIYKAKQ